LDIFKRSRSKSEYIRLFLIGAFPVHIWAIVNLLHTFPSMLLEMNTLELISILAYVLTFALFESLFVFALLFLVTWFFPRKISTPTLLAVSAILVFFGSIAVTLVHLYGIWNITMFKFESWVILWAAVGVVASGLTLLLVARKPKVEKPILSIVERLSLLSMLYVTLDLVGVVIVVIRNL
jgi:hypothetical protein